MLWGMDEPPLEDKKIGPLGYLWLVLRGILVGGVTYGCLLVLLVVRLVEWPLFGLRRPVTPWITQAVCRFAFFGMGMPVTVHGTPMTHRGAIVSNHLSWLDIFALNARQNVYFVAKSEVAKWPGIGWLARATGTVFIARKSAEAAAQKVVFEDRLRAGHRLVFFPEGTSSDGLRVLPFKSALFAAFFVPEMRDILHIQPVSLVYHAPPNAERRFYGWWAEMEFLPHMLRVLAQSPQGRVEIVFHPELRVADYADRKALAKACETLVRQGVEARLIKPV
jgi:1-acyl-sn-glycerol-3-phosphate acyltransferase